jgi:hypothetical protein
MEIAVDKPYRTFGAMIATAMIIMFGGVPQVVPAGARSME